MFQPPLQKASSLLKQLVLEPEHIALVDRSHASGPGGHLRVFGRVAHLELVKLSGEHQNVFQTS